MSEIGPRHRSRKSSAYSDVLDALRSCHAFQAAAHVEKKEEEQGKKKMTTSGKTVEKRRKDDLNRKGSSAKKPQSGL